MSNIENLVIDYFAELFDHIFSAPFHGEINERRKQNIVKRQVEESADAASLSLTRLFINKDVSEQEISEMMESLSRLKDILKIEQIANANLAPESLVTEILPKAPCPASITSSNKDALYRVALHSVVQVLMQIAPVMVEWKKLNFATTYELPRRIVQRLNKINEMLDAQSISGSEGADELFELKYRDYLLQRFYRVDTGTVKMTTNLGVDLRELFVMPSIMPRDLDIIKEKDEIAQADSLMNLSFAREIFSDKKDKPDTVSSDTADETLAVDYILQNQRVVIVGVPGSGKSTLFEYIQIQLAEGELELPLDGEQAIPLLLRVRNLDPNKLPREHALIEKATLSEDIPLIMPTEWIQRQMQRGRVLFMLDGLDETEPDIVKKSILPWLAEIMNEYPACGYVISSRPVGYPPGSLSKLKFVECNLKDFSDANIQEYSRHWCTAVRLSQNEPEKEARKKGKADGDKILESFEANPYIRNLAKNPLMLSAICLINKFEGGQLPADRAILYKLCVEGLLHHWDQKREIYSEFTLSEKLRVCREIAIAMQHDDRAEYEIDKVEKVVGNVLQDKNRAKKLMEHIRFRTGLLIERRTGVYAFAHLTFQEYLAALAVYEDNLLKIDYKRLADEHSDSRWKEVIALYCGLTPANAAKNMIKEIMEQENTMEISSVLTESYFVSEQEMLEDRDFRKSVIERVAVSPYQYQSMLKRFLFDEVKSIANQSLCENKYFKEHTDLCEAFYWLHRNHSEINLEMLIHLLEDWKNLHPYKLTELLSLVHFCGDDVIINQISNIKKIYSCENSFLSNKYQYENAFLFLALRCKNVKDNPAVYFETLINVLSLIRQNDYSLAGTFMLSINMLFENLAITDNIGLSLLKKFQELTHDLKKLITKETNSSEDRKSAIDTLSKWTKNKLEPAIAKYEK